MPHFALGRRHLCATLLLGLLLHGAPGPAQADGGRGRLVQIVSPGESIQAALHRAADGGTVLVEPGVYRETADATNGLAITRSVHLIGLSAPGKRVVIENAGMQRNGIVVVPADRTACMQCHASLAPPFAVLPGVQRGLKMREPMIRDLSIRGITVRGFKNNGLFLENVDGFSIVDVESVDNTNYGIFPTLSKNGSIRRSRATGSADAGVWVETSENVVVAHTVSEGNLIGFEVSNSDNIVLTQNEARDNAVGMGIFVLPFLFDDRPGTKRIVVEKNRIHRNNRINDGAPGTIAADLPSGTGIILMGVDDSRIVRNSIEGNGLTGVALVDYCVAFQGTPRDCALRPGTPDFLADQDATGNLVAHNVLVRNGMNPPPSPFAFAAGDLTLISFGAGNCYRKNLYATSFSLTGALPACR